MSKVMIQQPVSEGLSPLLLSRLSGFVSSRLGLYFPEARWRDLERGIGAASREFGFSRADECISWLMDASPGREHLEVLASCLTVGETYFFRDKGSFDALEKHVLPDLLRSRARGERNLRIWSAGCSTGEEPYSIAMLLDKTVPDLSCWNVTILASDINPRFLRKAMVGIYGEWSFRDAPEWVREGYFKKTGEGFEIAPQVRKMVSFSHLNLAEDPFPSLQSNTNAMDIIFCRNVLMYFSQDRAKSVVRKFHRCLVDGGWLIVSPVETSRILNSDFTLIGYPGAILHRKRALEAGGAVNEAIRDRTPAPTPRPFKSAPETPAPPTPMRKATPTAADHPPRPPRPPRTVDLRAEAVRLYEQGLYEDAARKAISILSIDGHDAETMTLLARLYANQGRLSDARSWCERAIAIEKASPRFHYLLATILQEQGQVVGAEASLRHALYLDPDFALAYVALGGLSRLQGRMKKSRKYLANALSILGSYGDDDVPPESEGINAGRLSEMVRAMLEAAPAVPAVPGR